MGVFFDLLVSVLTQGFIYALISYGVFITYKILDFPDLTVDGSFPLGAAVTAVLLTNGANAWLTLGAAALVGAAAGLCTGLIHVKVGVRDLLARHYHYDGAVFHQSCRSPVPTCGWSGASIPFSTRPCWETCL